MWCFVSACVVANTSFNFAKGWNFRLSCLSGLCLFGGRFRVADNTQIYASFMNHQTNLKIFLIHLKTNSLTIDFISYFVLFNDFFVYLTKYQYKIRRS